jgi:hypothetical protein
MTTQISARDQTFRGRRVLAPVAAILVGLASAAPPSGVAAQASNNPILQVIYLVNGETAQTVRVTYPAMAVKNVHVFTPVGGGMNVIIHPPATANQVYSLVVPAGHYKMKYATQTTYGGYPPGLNNYNPVIVIPPFKVVGRMCESSQAAGTPSS